MSEFLSEYCALISSPAQLASCQQANSLPELLSVIKRLWNKPELDDHRLLAELGQLNREIIDNNVQLAGYWLPYRYHPASRSIYWCLPDGHTTEPFQDEYISRCRQKILFNQIIQPRTSLDCLSRQAETIAHVQPTGFIFHLSRCGSTLVSGCLSELDSTCVFSESPVLTEILLDANLTLEEQKLYLQQLINLQASVFSSRPHVIIKWNAWDIFRWELIRAIYPQVPVIFLVRNPIEILASHARSVGRHMSGDISLSAFHPVFLTLNKELSLLEFRSNVLRELMSVMLELTAEHQVKLIDYLQLNADSLVQIIRSLQIAVEPEEIGRIQYRLQFHSKVSHQAFNCDIASKQTVLSLEETQQVQSLLLPVYNRLLNNN